MKAGVLLVAFVLLSSVALAETARLNEDFVLAENETASLAGTSVKITLEKLETQQCISGSYCVRKATLLVTQATVLDQEITLYEGDSKEILKLPLFLDSSQLTFAGMKGNRAVFVIQTLQVIIDKNSFLPREPIIVRAHNTGDKPITIAQGGKCSPAFSIYRGDKFLTLSTEEQCPPSIERILLRANETKIIGKWDQKYYNNCRAASCAGDYASPGDYALVVNRIKKRISIYDPNEVYIVSRKVIEHGTPISIGAQNMGNVVVEILNSPGCVSGFQIKDANGRQIILNPPGKCSAESSIKLLPGHYQELSVWNQRSYNVCSSSECEGAQVPEGKYIVQLTTKDGKIIDKEIIISPATGKPTETPTVPENGFLARIWEWLFG